MFSSLSLAQSYESGKPKDWLDLTGEKYSGSDKDLVGFKIVKPDTTCDELLRRCAVTWDTSSERASNQELKAYTIHFQVIDRKGKQVLEKSYKWDKDIRETKGDYVGRYKKFAEWPGITLDYSTVKYWAQDIKWVSKKAIKPKDDGPKAFTLQDAIEGAKKAKRVEDM